MKVTKYKDKIVVQDPTDFDVIQTLACGQIFRYQFDGDIAIVFSTNKMARLKTSKDKIEIFTDDVEYFYNFFDFFTDYSVIKNKLKQDELLVPAIKFAPGIRIINNDAFEMFVSFMISANNNIGRIKKSIESLCKHFGKDMGGYFAFPTLKEIKTATIEDFVAAGLGYRATQMFETIQKMTDQDIEYLKMASNAQKFDKLISFKGIGEKVANCIMLFGLGVRDVFPVDVWINKVYNHLYQKNETNRAKITKEMTEKYGDLSGYAQQYFYYYYRENKIG